MNARDLLRQVFQAAIYATRGDLLLGKHAALDGDRWSCQLGDLTVLLPETQNGGYHQQRFALIVLGPADLAGRTGQ